MSEHFHHPRKNPHSHPSSKHALRIAPVLSPGPGDRSPPFCPHGRAYGITRHAALCVWLPPLSLFPACWGMYQCFIPSDGPPSFRCMESSSMDQWMDIRVVSTFSLLRIMLLTNMWEQVLTWTYDFISPGSISISGTAGSYQNSVFDSLRSCRTIF